MIKLVILSVLSFVFVSTMLSQTFIVEALPVDGDWIYINALNEELVTEKISTPLKISHEFSEDGIQVIEKPKSNSYEFKNYKGELLAFELNHCDIPIHSHFMFKKNRGSINGVFVVIDKGDYGCYDISGKLIIPFEYNFISPFENGFATAKQGKEFFVINTSGEKTPIQTEDLKEVSYFHGGLAQVRNKSGYFGFINTKGVEVIKPQFKIASNFVNGVCWARADNKLYGLVDDNGNVVVEPKFRVIKDFDEESGLAVAATEEEKFYINGKGDRFDFVNLPAVPHFADGVAKTRIDGKIGFTDNKGNWIIEPKFTQTRSFHSGYCAAKEGELWGLIDKSGNWVIQPTYQRINDVIKIKE
jgi:hypothetical protein